MTDYRIFILDSGNRIIARVEISEHWDNAAIETARLLVRRDYPHSTGFEVWEAARVVHREMPDH